MLVLMANMIKTAINYLFFLLFFAAPLIFTPANSELFEYNKMMFVYALTAVITALWAVDMIHQRRLRLKKTPLDIPIGLFLVSQILSTIFSIDPHTSIWGYYSRSNGGLVSTISYILLFYAFVSNLSLADSLKTLKGAVLGGVVVALWGVSEHFGASPSCLILRGEFNDSCWVQDVAARVFATLGQPNWMAAYLAMLIFPAIYFALNARRKLSATFYSLFSILFYLGFTFTYSRGATLGLAIAFIVFLLFFFLKKPDWGDGERGAPLSVQSVARTSSGAASRQDPSRFLPIILMAFLLINLLFGSSLTGDFKLLKLTAAPPSHGVISGGTKLETGGTESGQIRLIVWKGALDIFKHYPIFGSGVETFGYSYYNFRPVEHNLVSEWDFLYNKAHNEYLNYLATTGSIGFLSYMTIIVTFIAWSIRRILGPSPSVLSLAILASYSSYLVQNFFGFSVVTIALFFYLFPAFSFLAEGELKDWSFSKTNPLPKIAGSVLRHRFIRRLSAVAILGVVLLCLSTLAKFWHADTLYKNGLDAADAGDAGRAYLSLSGAISLNDFEPLYRSELGNAAASLSSGLFEKEATSSVLLRDEAVAETQEALKISPRNTSIWRTAIRTYFELSLVYTEFKKTTLDAFDRTIKLAPTDPKLHYNKALVLEQYGQDSQALDELRQAVKLKPDYLDALLKLSVLEEKRGDIETALDLTRKILKYEPQDPGMLRREAYLATSSALKK